MDKVYVLYFRIDDETTLSLHRSLAGAKAAAEAGYGQPITWQGSDEDPLVSFNDLERDVFTSVKAYEVND